VSAESDPHLSRKRSRAANLSWANTANWLARTAAARKAAEGRFLIQADGDPKRAAKLRQAHFDGMILKSVAARKAKAAAAKAEAGDASEKPARTVRP
jgi:hypothetical protein